MPPSTANGTIAGSASANSGRAEGVVFVATAVAAAFSVYFCMYAFRKPFDAVTFPGLHVWGTVIELKTACVLGQIFGYLLSKYLGTKFCSEVSTRRTGLLLVSLILGAEAALVLFALLPNAGKPAAMFLNGLPLGMVWGLVVRRPGGPALHGDIAGRPEAPPSSSPAP